MVVSSTRNEAAEEAACAMSEREIASRITDRTIVRIAIFD
jgi:hypothetical protein